METVKPFETKKVRKGPRISLGPDDIAFIIRGRKGAKELLVPLDYKVQEVQDDHFMLIAFALGFEDQEVRDFMINVVGKKHELPDEPGPC